MWLLFWSTGEKRILHTRFCFTCSRRDDNGKSASNKHSIRLIVYLNREGVAPGTLSEVSGQPHEYTGQRNTYILSQECPGEDFLLLLPARVEHRLGAASFRPVERSHALLLQLDVVAAEKVVKTSVDVGVLVQLVLQQAQAQKQAREIKAMPISGGVRPCGGKAACGVLVFSQKGRYQPPYVILLRDQTKHFLRLTAMYLYHKAVRWD